MIRDFLRSVKLDVLHALPVRTAIVNLEFRKYHGRFPNLFSPQTFNEKITYRKLFERDPRMPRLADKVLVKEHVASLMGPEWVIPTLWSGSRLPPRSERDWPLPYAIKARHGCGWNIFVHSREDEDWDAIERTTEKWLRRVYGIRGREWLYSEIEPGLLVEPFMGEQGVTPPDYKFFVFGGQTKYIQVDLARFGDHRQFFYDTDWRRQEFTYACPYSQEEIPRPKILNDMIEAADRLGDDFPFVRIDMYEIHGRPYFGEYTFYPNGGRIEFKPASVELELGRAWMA